MRRAEAAQNAGARGFTTVAQQNNIPAAPSQEEQAAIPEKLWKQIERRLPLTFQPYFNQQLRSWSTLFPYERRYLLRVITYFDGLSPEEESQLFSGIRNLEEKMGISRWNYSGREQTLESSSLLARSAYYSEWRGEVERVFARIETSAESKEEQNSSRSLKRLVVMIFPACLPCDPGSVWARWPQTGQQIKVGLDDSGDERTTIKALFGGDGSAAQRGSNNFRRALFTRAAGSAFDVWILDAGAALSEFLLAAPPQPESSPKPAILSFERLKPLREEFLAKMNTMAHTLSSADEVFNRLRQQNFSSLYPPEIASDGMMEEFVRSLLLSGNGAAVFSNPFVQWGASEVFRRARPSVLIGYFGTRDKPKPFTSVAIFENQDIASPLPSVKDFAGSALDAEVLSYYVWLAANRYPEYKDSLTFCLAENLKTAYVVAGGDNPFQKEPQPLSLTRISELLGDWLA